MSDDKERATIKDEPLSIVNALVEEVYYFDRSHSGYIMAFYTVRDEFDNRIKPNLIRLEVSPGTVIKDQSGLIVPLCIIRKGMWIDAVVSPYIVKNVPLELPAFNITVKLDRTRVMITTDRVIAVDTDNNLLVIGNPKNIADRIILEITDETLIINKDGEVIPLSSIKRDQVVRVEHSMFQTVSIPPETLAFLVQVLSE